LEKIKQEEEAKKALEIARQKEEEAKRAQELVK
jgi:hypothetical protein